MRSNTKQRPYDCQIRTVPSTPLETMTSRPATLPTAATAVTDPAWPAGGRPDRRPYPHHAVIAARHDDVTPAEVEATFQDTFRRAKIHPGGTAVELRASGLINGRGHTWVGSTYSRSEYAMRAQACEGLGHNETSVGADCHRWF